MEEFHGRSRATYIPVSLPGGSGAFGLGWCLAGDGKESAITFPGTPAKAMQISLVIYMYELQ